MLFTIFEATGTYFIKVPELSLTNTINLVNEMWLLPDAKSFVFDFALVHEFTPLSLLYLSNEIRGFRSARSQSNFSVVNYKHATYAGHMGFFRTFGAEFGKMPGEASGGTSYLPITIENTSAIRLQAIENNMPIGEYIDKYIAKRMAKVLISDTSSHSFNILAFCIREIIRNVLEHSETELFAYCAQYWPAKGKASLAILDRGMGVQESLRTNPYLSIGSDKEAISLSIQPAISGKMHKGVKVNHNDDWQNSGFGLFMTSEICKLGGSFFIGSGESALHVSENDFIDHNVMIGGTLINLDIDTSDMPKLEDLTMAISSKVYKKRGGKPSKASLGEIV